MAELGQLAEVAPRRVVRDAAHGDRIFLPLVARGERQVEDARRVDRVVVEHLVEVAEPEEHDGVRVPRLDVEVLAHQRGGRGGLQECAGARPAPYRSPWLFLRRGGLLLAPASRWRRPSPCRPSSSWRCAPSASPAVCGGASSSTSDCPVVPCGGSIPIRAWPSRTVRAASETAVKLYAVPARASWLRSG